MELNTFEFANWYQNFPEWWRQDAFLDAIGAIIAEVSIYYAYILLTSKLEQPVQVWLDAQREETDYVLTEDVTKLPYKFIGPAPLYKTKGQIKINFNCDKYLQNFKIMINSEDGLQLPFSVKNGLLLIDLDNDKYYLNDNEIDLTTIGNGITYFKTSKFKDVMNENTPLHNEAVIFTLSSDNNIEDEVNLSITEQMDKPVFHVEQNVKLSTISALPLREVKMYVYYDTPFNESLKGWRYVFQKKYPRDTITTYDRFTKHYFAKTFYIEAFFDGLDYGITVGFPQSSNIDNIKDPFHINMNLDKWGALYELPRRQYKDGVNEVIDEFDYPTTLPPYYPYPDEQDYWYERRLLNEYVWNRDNLDNTFIQDNEYNNVIFLQDIDPYVEDLVIEAGTKLPNEIAHTNIVKDILPINLLQQSTSGKNKQIPFKSVENLLVDDKYKYTTISLDKMYNQSLSLERYRSYMLDLMFNLSTLPKDIIIKGLEFEVDAEGSNNSDLKFNDVRTGILLNNIIDYDKFLPFSGVFRPSCYSCIYKDDYNGDKEYIKTWGNYCPYCGSYHTLNYTEASVDGKDKGSVVCKNCGAKYCGFCGTLISAGKTNITKNEASYKLIDGVYLSYSQKIDVSRFYDKKRAVISYGAEDDLFGLSNTVSNGYKQVDLRDYLADNGLHFLFGLTNQDQQQDCIINIYSVKLNIYYENKESDFLLSSNLNYNDDDTANINIVVTNNGDVEINDNIYIVTSPLLEFDTLSSKTTIPLNNLLPNSTYNKTIKVYPKTQTSVPDGEYDVLVTFGGKQQHLKYKVSSDGLIPTTTYVEPAYSIYKNKTNKTTTLTAYVTTKNNDKVNGVVRFYIDDYLIKQNGIYEFEIEDNKVVVKDVQVPLNLAGLYNIEAKYLGTDKYAPSNYINTILISKKITKTTLSSITHKVLNDENPTVDFTATIVDEDNIPVNEGTATFYIKNNEKYQEVGKTNVKLGKAILTTSNIINIIGDYDIKVIYNGTIGYGVSDSESTLTLNGGDVDMTVFDYNVLVGDEFYISAKVLDMIKRPVTSGVVTFEINNEVFENIPLNNQGIASISYTAKETLMSKTDITPKVYTIKAKYIDLYNGVYNASESTGNLTVDRLYTYIIPNDTYATQGQTVAFLVRVMNGINTPATQGIVDIVINGKSYGTGEVDKYGYARIFYNTLSLTYEEWMELVKFSFTQELHDTANNIDTKVYGPNGELITDDLIEIYDGVVGEAKTNLMISKRSFIIEDGKLYVTLPSGDNTEVFSIENGNLYISKNAIKQGDLIGDYTYDINYTSEYRYKCSTNQGKLSMLNSVYSLELLEYYQEYGDTINISTSLANIDGVEDLSKNGYIRFYIDNKQIGDKFLLEKQDIVMGSNTDTRYVATCSGHKVTEIPDTYILRAEYVSNTTNEILFNVFNKYIVQKITPKINLSHGNIFAGTEVLFKTSISFINSINELIPKGTLVIKLNDTDITTLNINGFDEQEFAINIPVDANTVDYTLSLDYNGTEYIDPIRYSTIIKPVIADATISIPEIQVAVGNDCSINVSVTDNGNPISDGSINLKLQTSQEIDLGTSSVLNGIAHFDFHIDKNLIPNKYQLIAEYSNGINYKPQTGIIQVINIIDGLDTIYVSTDGSDISSDGSESKPFATLSHALECLNNNGTIYIKKGIYETNDVAFNKNTTIIGENDVIIRGKNKDNITFTVLEGFEILIKNMSFSESDIEYYFTIKGDMVGKDKGALTFTSCLLDKTTNISNLNGFLTINKSAVLGTLNISSGTNVLDNNWWGTNNPTYSNILNNWVTAELTTSLDKFPTVGDKFKINVDFKGINNDDIYPQRKVSFNAPYGDLSIYIGTMVNNHIDVEYSNYTTSCELKAIVDDEVLKLSIEDYIKNIEIKLQNIETPIGYNTPIHALVANVNNKLINYGKVKYYLNDNFIRDVLVTNGTANFSLFIDSSYEVDKIYKLTAVYYDDLGRYCSTTTSSLKIIANNNICFVDSSVDVGDGSFKKPFKTLSSALKTNNSTIYIKSGVYNEDNWVINRDVTIKSYDDDVIFNKGSTILSTGVNTNIIVDGIQFSNYETKDSLIYNNGNLTITNCILISNTANSLIYNEGKYDMIYSAIVNNKGLIIDNAGTCNIDYNWWGSDTPNTDLLNNATIKYWVIMDFKSNIDPINIDDIVKLTASLSHYTDSNKVIYDLTDITLPSRKSLFGLDTSNNFKQGSLIPLYDYTDLQNKAQTMYNTTQEPNSLKVYLSFNDNTNYFNDDELKVSCNVINGYGDKVNQGNVSFTIDGVEAGKVDVRDGVAVLNVTNTFGLSLGEHTITALYSDNILISSYISDIFNIKLIPIIIKDIKINASIYGLNIEANATDIDNNNIINEEIEFYIDNKLISQKDLDGNLLHYYINNGKIAETLSYSKIVHGQHSLTIKCNPETVYDTLVYTTTFNIPYSPTTITYDDEYKLNDLYIPNNFDNDLIFKIKDEKGLIVNDGYMSVYKDDILLNNKFKITDGIITIDKSITNNKGIYILTFIYETDGYYYESSVSKFTLNIGLYNVNIEANNIEASYLDDINIKANIYNKENILVNSGLVDIYEVQQTSGYRKLIAENISCKTGSINFTYSGTLEAGNYYLELIYKNEDNKIYYAETHKTINLLIRPRLVSFNTNNSITTISNTKKSVKLDIKSANTVVNSGLVNAYANINNTYVKISNTPINNNNVSNNIISLDLTIPAMDIGTYNLKLEYVNNNKFGNYDKSDNVTEIITLNIIPNYTTITSFTPIVCYPTSTVFEVNIKDSQSNTVNTGYIDYYIDNNKVGTMKVVSGTSSFTYTPNKVKELDILLKYYDNDGLYSESSVHKTVTVKPSLVDVDVYSIETYNGDSVSIPYNVICNDNINTISDGELSVSLNNEILDTSYILNGKGTINFEVPLLPTGTYNISLSLFNSKLYAPYTKTIQLIIKPKIIDIIMDNINASVSDEITIAPKFDKNISGLVYCYINNNFINLEKLDNQNTFEYKYILPNDMNNVDNTITIKFAGNEYYAESTEDFNLAITKTTGTINLDEIKAEVGNTITFNATTSLPNNKRIDFYINDNVVTEGVVKDGKVTGTYILPYTYLKNIYTIKANFEGSAVYNTINSTNTLTILPADIKSITLNTLEAYKVGTLSLIPKIIDINNNIITDGVIEYKIKTIDTNEVIQDIGTLGSTNNLNDVKNILLSTSLINDSYVLDIIYTSNNTNMYNNYETTQTLVMKNNDFTIDTVQLIKNIGDIISFNNITVKHSTTDYNMNGKIAYQILDSTDSVIAEYETDIVNNVFSLEFNISSKLSPNTYNTRFVYKSDDKIFSQIYNSSSIIIEPSNTIYVDNTKDSSLLYGTKDNPLKTINDGLVYVANNGILNINGSYNESLVINKNITINGADGSKITGDNTNPIIVNNKSLNINNIQLSTNNTDKYSSGIVNNGTVTVDNCEFNNLVGKFSGAIYTDGISSIKNSIFKNNTGTNSGAIYLGRQSVTSLVTGCRFDTNISNYNGGAIYSYNADNINIDNNIFIKNSCQNYGGAIYITGNGNICKNIFTNNNAIYNNGGGAVSLGEGSVDLEYNIFENNISNNVDNEIYNINSECNLVNNYFGNNLTKDQITSLIYGKSNMNYWSKVECSTNPDPLKTNTDCSVNINLKSTDGNVVYDLQDNLPNYNVSITSDKGTITSDSIIKNNICSAKYNSSEKGTISIKVGNYVNNIEVKE